MITFEAARTALHEVVAEAGENHRYTSPKGSSAGCVNVSNGAPHCLVAKVLQRLGVDVVGFCHANPSYIGSSVRSLIVAMKAVDSIERDALSYLGYAQSLQDEYDGAGQSGLRRTWGQVRDRADERARSNGWLS